MQRGIGILLLIVLVLLVPVFATFTSITQNSPANDTHTADTTPAFVFTPVSDINTTFNCSLIIDSVVAAQNLSVNNNTPTTLISGVLAEGAHTWNINCSDVNETASSLVFNITIDTTAPAAVITSPANDTHTSDTTPLINFTLTDNLASVLNFTIYVDGAANGQTGTVPNASNTGLNITALTEGAHVITVEALDLAGNRANSTNLTLTVDVTVPVVTITSPINNTNTSDTTPQINFTITDNLASTLNFTVFVDGAANGQTGTVANDSDTGLNITALAEGTHLIIVEGLDLAGNRANSTPNTLTIDTTNPVVTITSPANNTNTSDTTPQINFTITNLASTLNFTIFVDGTPNGQTGTVPNATNTGLNLTTLAEGTHIITVEGLDQVGNRANDSITLTVDLTGPTVIITSPVNNTNTSDTTPQINFTITDNLATALNFTIFVDGTPNGQTGTVSNATNTGLNLTALTEGTHLIIVEGQDQAGNKANASLTLTVDLTGPVVTLNIPVDNTNSSSSSITFNWSVTDNADTLLNCNLTLDAAVNVSDILSLNGTSTITAIAGINEGAHFWNVTCIDDAGNTGNSATRSFKIDTTPPNITQVAPLNGSTTGLSVTFTWNAQDNIDTTLPVTLFIDGVVASANIASANGTDTSTVVVVTAGPHNWSVNVSDSLGNGATSPTSN